MAKEVIAEPHKTYVLELLAALGPAAGDFVVAGAQAMKFYVEGARAKTLSEPVQDGCDRSPPVSRMTGFTDRVKSEIVMRTRVSFASRPPRTA